jgi:hypothetical protein
LAGTASPCQPNTLRSLAANAIGTAEHRELVNREVHRGALVIGDPRGVFCLQQAATSTASAYASLE